MERYANLEGDPVGTSAGRWAAVDIRTGEDRAKCETRVNTLSLCIPSYSENCIHRAEDVHYIHAAGRATRRVVAAAEGNGCIRRGWRGAPAGDRTGRDSPHRRAVAADASDCDKKRAGSVSSRDWGQRQRQSDRVRILLRGVRLLGRGIASRGALVWRVVRHHLEGEILQKVKVHKLESSREDGAKQKQRGEVGACLDVETGDPKQNRPEGRRPPSLGQLERDASNAADRWGGGGAIVIMNQ